VHQIWLAVRAPLGVALLVLVPLSLVIVTGLALRERVPVRWRGALRTGLDAGAVVVALGMVAALTLAPSAYPLHAVNLVPFRDVLAALRAGDDATRSAVNCAGNAALFVPLGLAVAASRRRPSLPRTLLVCAAVSLLVEVLQYATPVGRIADVTDVAMNITGASMGWAALRLSASAARKVAEQPV
jgi:glycopeptide antibiotics resistance protein